jgi:hypothetical protein
MSDNKSQEIFELTWGQPEGDPPPPSGCTITPFF